jgi:NADH-quinone oxidoreductase subunit J
MPPLLFYLFAALTLGFGLFVVLSRNPVTSALSLAMSFVGLAALFISLDAYFIGTIQILVYAGAVMVLFLFIIMLLDIKAESGKRSHLGAVVGSIVVASVLSVQIATVSTSLSHSHSSTEDTPLNLAAAEAKMIGSGKSLGTITKDLASGELPDTKLMGLTLFRQYAFHLQVIGLLLLVGTVGVVVLSKREKEVAP